MATTSKTYTFSNVTAGHTISATFSNQVAFSIDWTASEFSTVQYKIGSGSWTTASNGVDFDVTYGSTIQVKATPATGNTFTSATVRDIDDTTVLDTLTPSSNTVSWTVDLIHDQSITLNASTTTYTITPSAGTGGTISPSTAQTVSHGGSVTFTVSANSGYKISQILVDGSPISL